MMDPAPGVGRPAPSVTPSPRHPVGAVPGGEEARLRRTAQQLEGVFVEQLFKAMRETVPEGGLLDGGTGEEIFTGMLDQKMAAEVPADWESGLGAALYRQLRGVLSAAPAADQSSGGGEG